MSSQSQTTTNHEEIKKWVEKRNGQPAVVKNDKDGITGILRIDFPGYSGEDSLEPIDWDEFFKIFDERNLKFLYQDATADGGLSRFNKFVAAD